MLSSKFCCFLYAISFYACLNCEHHENSLRFHNRCCFHIQISFLHSFSVFFNSWWFTRLIAAFFSWSRKALRCFEDNFFYFFVVIPKHNVENFSNGNLKDEQTMIIALDKDFSNISSCWCWSEEKKCPSRKVAQHRNCVQLLEVKWKQEDS